MTTDTAPTESIKELIKKCLALSSSPNEHEATAAMDKATQLLEKYNLSLMDITGLTAGQPRPDVMINLPLEDMSDSWSRNLMYRIAKLNFCEGVKIGDTLHILGRPTNVITTVEVGFWVIEQIDGMSLNQCAGRGRVYANSFKTGASDRVMSRLQAGRTQRTVDNSQLRALVPVLEAEVSSYMYQEYPRLRTSYSHHRTDYAGYRQGQQAGDAVSLARKKQVDGNGNGHLLGR